MRNIILRNGFRSGFLFITGIIFFEIRAFCSPFYVKELDYTVFGFFASKYFFMTKTIEPNSISLKLIIQIK